MLRFFTRQGTAERKTNWVHFDTLGVCTTNVDGGTQAQAVQCIAVGAQQMRVTGARESAAHVKANAGDHIVVPLYENGIGDASS